jgi:hypothetical protein
MTFPSSSKGAIGIFWGLLILEEACAFWAQSRRAVKKVSPMQVPVPVEPHVMQHFVRSRAENGAEKISGWLRIPVETGQQIFVAHVAFCPPLAQIPQFDLYQTEGPQARLRTTQLLAYGARIELRLNALPAKPTEIVVHFEASALSELTRRRGDTEGE